MPSLRRYLLTFAILPLLCIASAHAAMVFMKASLDGPQAGAATAADGCAFITYDTATRLLTWSVNYRNLTTALIAAHFHGPAARGVEAAVQIPIANTASPIEGSVTIAPAQEADLLAGLYYVNLHTITYPNGEIRGQVERIDTNFYDVFTSAAGGPFPTDHLQGTVTFDPATLMMGWSIAYGVSMASMPTGAGFHGPATPAQIAPATITTPLSPSPVTGSMMLTAAQAAELVNGFWYFAIDNLPIIRAQVLPSHPRLANISTRARVLTGNNVVIAGFIVGGSASKTVAVTATGPSLAGAGITNALTNPKITLVRSSDQGVVATNDDWQAQADAGTQLQTAGLAPADALESGILVTLPPGAYTAIVEGANGGTGVGLVAVYEVDRLDVPLVNISTRAQVLTGNDVVIAGFIIQGNQPKTVAITGTGPSLAAAGIANPLADPTLTLVRSSDQAVVATNDDWQAAANFANLQAAGFAPLNAKEPAIMVTLDPGAYTAILSGVGGGIGVGIVAVYAVQ